MRSPAVPGTDFPTMGMPSQRLTLASRRYLIWAPGRDRAGDPLRRSTLRPVMTLAAMTANRAMPQ